MTKSRVQGYLEPQLLEDFASYSSISRLNLFVGPQDIETLISEYIKHREEKARKEGIKEAVEKIIFAIREQTDSYVNLIMRIVDFIHGKTEKEFKNTNVKIIESRINFCFDTQWINALFIIEADGDGETAFSQMLSTMRQFIFDNENYIAELFYINSKNARIDKSAIISDYPYARKDKS